MISFELQVGSAWQWWTEQGRQEHLFKVAGVLRPDQGLVEVAGMNRAGSTASPFPAKPDQLEFPDRCGCDHDGRIANRIFSWPSRRLAAGACVKAVNLEDHSHRQIGQLSGGHNSACSLPEPWRKRRN